MAKVSFLGLGVMGFPMAGHLSSNGFDKFGNYTFGIKEHIVFPEVNFDKVDKIRGLDITIVTTSKTKKGALELLKEFNFPLNNKKN